MTLADLLVPRPNCPLTGKVHRCSRWFTGVLADGVSNLSKCFLTIGRRINQLEQQSDQLEPPARSRDPEPVDAPAHCETVTVGVQTERILLSMHKWASLAQQTTQVHLQQQL